MRLRDLGEFGLIDRIARAAARVPRGSGVVLGIGDDAALLRPGRGEDVVLTTDAFVSGVHFRWETQAARRVGRSALAATLSDLAAMGARPLGFTLALAAPPALEVARALGLVRGLLEGAAAFRCPLVGGNVTRARDTSLSLAALGAVRRGRALTRCAARPGDRILVTGALGGAALDLARSRRGGAPRRRVPEPRLAAGRALARLSATGACIDLSDGLLADLGHVLRASGVGAEIEARRVPLPPGFAARCARLGLDPLRLALGGGEDYELLFTLRPGAPSAAALARRLGLAVTEIGRITARRGLRLRGAGGRARAARPGWRHF